MSHQEYRDKFWLPGAVVNGELFSSYKLNPAIQDRFKSDGKMEYFHKIQIKHYLAQFWMENGINSILSQEYSRSIKYTKISLFEKIRGIY